MKLRYKIRARLTKNPLSKPNDSEGLVSFGKFGEIRVSIKNVKTKWRYKLVLTQYIEKVGVPARLEKQEALWASLPQRVQSYIFCMVDDLDPTNSYPYTEIHTVVD